MINRLNSLSSFAISVLHHFGGWIPDKQYIKWHFRLEMGRKLDLETPKTFSEKLQWLKLYNRNPKYTMMVDKLAVKDYVVGIIGDEYIIPTIGVWDKPEDIDWERLPNQFVLKTTHGGGSTGVVICRDKTTFDRKKAIDKLNASLKMDIYRLFREWPYKDVPRKVLAEQYIDSAPHVLDLPDYKWYCFGGEPKYCQVIQDRNSNETIDFFDTDWNHQPFVGLNPKATNAKVIPLRPINLETHLYIVRELSKGIPFSRIDLYETRDKTYFGEVTFYPGSGLGRFRPDQYNDILGEMLELPVAKALR